MKTLLASIVLAATASCLAAQQTLTTTFANNNGGSIGGAIYFDLTSTTGGILTDLDLNFGNAAGTVGSIDIYQIQNGTFAGNETNMASWTMIDSVAVTAAGVGQPTLCPLTIPIILNAQRDAYCIVANGLSHSYTTGTAPFPLQYTGCGLTMDCGTASNVPFTATIFSPRVANANIRYFAGSCCAEVESLGTGCVAPAPLTLDGIGRPIMGPGPVVYQATTSNIEASAIFHVGLLSASAFPLPGLNIPGTDPSCNLIPINPFVAASSPQVVVGTPAITWDVITLPAANPILCGFVVYVQSATDRTYRSSAPRLACRTLSS